MIIALGVAWILDGLEITIAFWRAPRRQRVHVPRGYLNATTQAIWWSVIFFFASAGASAAYLTVSETFPLEVRAKAIAVFFPIAQCFGSLGTHLYGHLVGNGHDHNRLFLGYLLGAVVMVIGGIVEIFLGVAAEGQSLEDVATPLPAVRRIPEFGSGHGAPKR